MSNYSIPRTKSKAKERNSSCSTKNKDQSHREEDQGSKYCFATRLGLISIVFAIVSRRMLRFGHNICDLSVCRNSCDSTVAILVHVDCRIQISALNHAGGNRELNIVEGA